MIETIIAANNVFKSFNRGAQNVPVLRGVSFSLTKGETVAIVGSSGAGKSTFLHLLGLLEPPTSGTILHEQQNLFQKNENQRADFRNRKLGFVFQFHYLLPEFTALENVLLPGQIAERHRDVIEPIAKQLLTNVGLGHRMHHLPSELSGGESQRVAIARAMLMQPEVILGDEITGNLDSENGALLMDLLLELNRAKKTSLVIVTHDMKVAQKMGRIVEMRDGVVIQ